MLPVFRSVYETSQKNEISNVNLIYFASAKTSMFYSHPVVSDDPYFYRTFVELENEPICKDANGAIPSFYYFPCRDWWIRVKSLFQKNSTNDIVITNPYKLIENDNLVATVCIKFFDPITAKYEYNSPPGYSQLSTICLDLSIRNIIPNFDKLNQELSGYFFILQVGSNIPLYYPLMAVNDNHIDISENEFNNNTVYFVEELQYFNQIVKPILIGQYSNNVNGTFTKNSISHSYTIIPINLRTSFKESQNATHILSLVYIEKSTTVMDGLTSFQGSMYPRLFHQVFVYICIGSILVMIAWSLTTVIAINVVKPIKNLRELIQGLNKKKANKSEIIIEKEQDGDNQMFDGEEDEENVEMRSEEMERLYVILLNLKNTLSFANNSRMIQDRDALIKYVFAKDTFNQVSNHKGQILCESNAGNIAIKCGKYDKAILHLYETIKDRLQNVHEIIDVLQMLKHLRGGRQVSLLDPNKVDTQNEGCHNPSYEESYNDIEPTSTIFTGSRYPKLIYAYKLFFKHIHLIPQFETKEDAINSMMNKDIFALKNRHSLNSYEMVIKSYITELITTNQISRTADLLLQYISFLMKFTLKQKENNNENMEATFKNIRDYFKEFEMLAQRMKMRRDSKSYKLLLDAISSGKNINELETPYLVIMQRSYYLKGKFANLCGHYEKALSLFFKSRQTLMVCDSRIIKKSCKHILRISTMLQDKIRDHLEHSEMVVAMNPSETIVSKKGSETLLKKTDKMKEKLKAINKYINSLQKDMNYFQEMPKDMVILIDISDTSKNSNINIDRAIKTTDAFFDSYITCSDRFTVFLYDNAINPVVPLTYKDYNTYSYVKNQLSSLYLEVLASHDYRAVFNSKVEEELQTQAEIDITRTINTYRAIKRMYKYLYKKSQVVNKREKWIIIFTENLKPSKVRTDIFDYLKQQDESLHICVVSSSNDKREAQCLDNLLQGLSCKSVLVDPDNIGQFKSILRTYGSVKPKITFANEYYETDKTKLILDN